MTTSISTSVKEAGFDPQFLDGINLTGFEDPINKRLMEAQHLIRKAGCATFKPLLPVLFQLNGQPFTLERTGDGKHHPGYYPFETFYRTRMPRRTLFKCGRQVAKSSNLAVRGLCHTNCVPHFKTLYITPLFEMIRRFSSNYVRPFIETSVLKRLFIGSGTVNSVLQRTFRNQSMMLFSFAFQDCNRVRGVSANKCSFDEVQDLDKDHLPIIRECMSGSPWGVIEEYAGTPKSMENTIQGLWNQSSQAEWVMKCVKCGYWNVPAMTHDLDAMIGPWHEDISFENPGIVCAKCKQPRSVFPDQGRWVHAYPEQLANKTGGRWDFAGYHMPQIIMPMHYADPDKWSILLGKQEGRGNTPLNVFYNEVCGESYDSGSRIVTMTELQQASILPWINTLSEARSHYNPEDYLLRVLSCDWGGGGEDGVSFTVYAVLGLKPDGKIDVIFGYRSLTPHDHEREARLALGLANEFGCQAIAHDYTGAGSIRETLMVQAGYPYERIVPVAYMRAASMARPMAFKPPTKNRPRGYFACDKTRSLLLTCQQIKKQWIRFFSWDYVSDEDTGLTYDFLGLVDEKVDSHIGTDIYTITRDPNMRDDFAQAVNIGACTIWHMTDKWPDMAAIAHLQVPQALLDAIAPPGNDVLQELA